MKVSVFFDGQNFYRSLQRYDESLRVDYDRLAAWITQAVGGASAQQPPITRWDYPSFSVYFEHDKVIHAVAKHQ